MLNLCVVVLVLVTVDGAGPHALHSENSTIVLGSKNSVPTLQQASLCVSVTILCVGHGEASIRVMTPFALVELEAVGHTLISVCCLVLVFVPGIPKTVAEQGPYSDHSVLETLTHAVHFASSIALHVHGA